MAIRVTGGEPGWAATVQVPAGGLARRTYVVADRGSANAMKPVPRVGGPLDGVVMRRPSGPVIRPAGGPPAPVIRAAATRCPPATENVRGAWAARAPAETAETLTSYPERLQPAKRSGSAAPQV